MTAAKNRTGNITGIIVPGSLLTAEEAKRRLGLGDWAWRTMRRQGLCVVRMSGKTFVLADDLIQFAKTKKE